MEMAESDNQSAVVDFLSEAASHGTAGPVDRIDTHCSIVFLTGERAYKLKRAVRYSYLDYSTVALREKFCRAELALNQRTAPALYLRVRSVNRTPEGTLTFDGNGKVLDWVLEMRRFREEDLFERMAESDRLTPTLMRRLADHIACFHEEAEPTPHQGGAERFGATLTGNWENLALSSPPLDRQLIERHHDASWAQLRKIGALLDRRRTGGMVRRCHGDLHLRNICLYEGRPTLFDAIEFNDDFSCIDVLYDLAFLLMDLIYRARTDLANLVLNRYLDRTGEQSALPALPLFLSTRAAVRAHVQGTLARTASDEQSAAARAASAYLTLALALLQEHRPQLLALGGLSGTGKSTIAQAIAPEFAPQPGARVLRSDVLRKRRSEVSFETRLPESSYVPSASRQVYEALREEAMAIAAAGYTVIVDATFLSAAERQRIAELAQRAGLPFTGLWLEAPPDMLAKRIRDRHGDASDADRAVLEQQLDVNPGTIDWPRIDASGSIPATIAAVKAKCPPFRPAE